MLQGREGWQQGMHEPAWWQTDGGGPGQAAGGRHAGGAHQPGRCLFPVHDAGAAISHLERPMAAEFTSAPAAQAPGGGPPVSQSRGKGRGVAGGSGREGAGNGSSACCLRAVMGRPSPRCHIKRAPRSLFWSA